jgi:hypothetical protein
MVTNRVVNDTQVNVRQKLACNISHLLMLGVELNSIVVTGGICLAHLHVIDTNAVVSQSFSVNVANRSANLQKLLVLVHSHLVFAKVVV